MSRRGFTLIEMSLVLLIAAMAAAAVALRLQSPVNQAEMRDVAERIVEFDRLSRQYAGQHDQALRLSIDLGSGELSRVRERDGQVAGSRLRLPSGFRIARLLVGQEDVASGLASVSCSRLGLTPTYAVLVEGKGNQKQWLLFAGLSGQLHEADDEQTVREILAAGGPRRHAR